MSLSLMDAWADRLSLGRRRIGVEDGGVYLDGGTPRLLRRDFRCMMATRML